MREIEVVSNYIGSVFGYLTIIKDAGRDKNGRYVKALCKCGRIKKYRLSHVKYGKIKSCGCYSKEQAAKRNWTHGLSSHPLYGVRQNIINRCKDMNDEHYGKRGVRMCEEWLNDFKSFYDWAISNGWKKGMEVDKDAKAIKLGLPPPLIYSPDWCSIITRKTNARNTRTNVFVEYNNETKTIAEWCEIVGISQKRFYSRIKRGWSLEKTLTTNIHLIN